MKTFIAVLLSALLGGAAAHATTVQDIENYLNNLTTFEADFEQYAPGHPIATGTFYLKRPKQFLWQYKTPSLQKLVATGQHLFFYDEENEQTTQLPMNSGIASILTQPTLNLTGDNIHVANYSQTDDVAEISLEMANADDTEMAGRITLILTKAPLTLTHIITTDALGNTTRVRLRNSHAGHTLSDTLFAFENPYEVLVD